MGPLCFPKPHRAVNELLQEMRGRFPEMCGRTEEEDADLPYVLMAYLAEWLDTLPGEHFPPDVVNRVVEFCRWCEDQPRTEDAGTDLLTIVVVGFYEDLFDSPKRRALLPKLIPREDLEDGAEYWRAWVGDEKYREALKQY